MSALRDPVPPGFETRLRERFATVDAALAAWVSADGCTLASPEADLPAALLLALGPAGLRPVLLGARQRLRPKREAKNHREGLLVVDREPLAAHGECPGGHYSYVTDPALAVELLEWWASQQAWAAVDLETAVGWRKEVDPQSGVWTRRWTDSSDAFTSAIMLCSVSVEPGEAVVFDFRRLGEAPGFRTAFRRFLTECRLVCHNAPFEQGFFQAQLGVLANVRLDTLVLHQLLTAGLPEKSDLESVTTKYTGIAMEKKWQKFFIQIHPESPLPNDAIRYSAGDVCQLLAIARQIETDYLASGQYSIWKEIEQPFMPTLAMATFHGITVDREKLESLKRRAEQERDRHLQAFQALAPGVLISSWQQVLAWFATHDVRLENTAEKALAKVATLCAPGTVPTQAAAAILGYRDAAKMVSTYIQPYLTDLVNPVSGRIHPQWKQASTTTGRMAAARPNLQNIPAGGDYLELREAIVARPGMLLAWADYSQFEVRALADAANEPKMLAVFREAYEVNQALEALVADYALEYTLEELTELPEKKPAVWQALHGQFPALGPLVRQAYGCDFHRRTAATLFKKPVTEITKEERRKSKCVTFALPYGAGPRAVAEQAKISREEAVQLIREYERQFPRVKEFLMKCKQAGRDGVTQTAAGRKRRYLLPNLNRLHGEIQALAEDPERVEEWQALRGRWNAATVVDVAQARYRAEIGALEREATNQPIQGCVTGDSRIFTREHGYVAIETLVGESISVWDGSRFAAARVAASGRRQRLRVTLKGGHTVDVSPDHRFLVRDTRGQERWVTAARLGEIGKNNRVVLTAAPGDWHLPPAALPPRKSRSWNGRAVSLDSISDPVELGEWLGRLAAEGGVTDTTIQQFVAEHEECLLPRLQAVTKRLGPVRVTTRQNDTQPQRFHALTLCSRTLAEQLQQLGVRPRIPDLVWRSRALLGAYLRGLFDGDGTVSPDGAILTFGEGERHRAWAWQVQEALLLLGVRSRVRTYHGDRTVVQVRKYDMPAFCASVGFMNPAKQLKARAVSGLACKGTAVYGWAQPVLQVETTDDWVEMYDVVDSATGRFMVNGMVVHNCNADATKLASVLAAPRLAALSPECVLIMWVHDEVCLEVPAALVRPAATLLKEAMIEGAERYLKRCPVEVGTAFGPRWGK